MSAEVAIAASRSEAGLRLPVERHRCDHALTVGFSRAFLVAAGIGLLALLIAIATIRVRRQDLSAAPEPQPAAPQPAAPQPAAPQPGTVQVHESRAALAAAARPCRLC